jgi:hypothetical protein
MFLPGPVGERIRTSDPLTPSGEDRPPPTHVRDVTTSPEDVPGRSEAPQPLPAAASVDAVEGALAKALEALTFALGAATTTEERLAVARELGDVSRALEARRAARAGVVDMQAEARKRGRG